MQKELMRLDNYLKECPNLDIWVISEDTAMGKAYWNWIREFIDTKKKPKVFSQSIKCIDGLNPKNALIVLCGYWYMNPIFKYGLGMLEDAAITLPIGEISK